MIWFKPVAPAVGVGIALMVSACAMPDPLRSHIQGCPVGGEGFSQCMARAALTPDESRERRRWIARLQREQVEAEARVRRERAVAGLSRP